MRYDDILDVYLLGKPIRKINLALVAIVPIVGGALIGLTTDVINGHIFRPRYSILPVVKGLEAGLMFGAFFGLVFTIVVGESTRRYLTVRRLFKVYLQCMAIVLFFWSIAGCTGAVLYYNYPEIAPRLVLIPRRLHAAAGWANVSVVGSKLGSLVVLLWAIYTTRDAGQRPSGRS